MIELSQGGVYLLQGQVLLADGGDCSVREANNRLHQAGLPALQQDSIDKDQAKTGTMAYQILTTHTILLDSSHSPTGFLRFVAKRDKRADRVVLRA